MPPLFPLLVLSLSPTLPSLPPPLCFAKKRILGSWRHVTRRGSKGIRGGENGDGDSDGGGDGDGDGDEGGDGDGGGGDCDLKMLKGMLPSSLSAGSNIVHLVVVSLRGAEDIKGGGGLRGKPSSYVWCCLVFVWLEATLR